MRHLLLIAALTLMAWPATVHAQILIRGQVIDNETLEPIPSVEVRIHNVRNPRRTIGRLHTNDEGTFTFTAPSDGGYVFRADRIGYEGTETPTLWTDGYRTYHIEIRLDPDAVLLAPIEVLVREKGGDSPVLASFQHRAGSGMGTYFNHRDIERIKPSRVTDLLAQVPGVVLQSTGSGLRRVVYMARGRNCPAEIFVDGMLWTRGGPAPESLISVDDAVAPSSVYGIEVYRGLSTVPAEFLTARSRCGVVAIWTRR
jgi:hypothetical protein